MEHEKAAPAAVQYDVDLISVKMPTMQPGVPDSAAEESSTAKADGAGAAAAAAADSRSTGKHGILYCILCHFSISRILCSIERKHEIG
jgi:hypothetical protein